MRTKEFNFKKVKRIKQEVVHTGLEINLTEQEVADLRVVMGMVNGDAASATSGFTHHLYKALLEFTETHNKVVPRIRAKNRGVSHEFVSNSK